MYIAAILKIPLDCVLPSAVPTIRATSNAIAMYLPMDAMIVEVDEWNDVYVICLFIYDSEPMRFT